jgi:hypothetical protein
MIDGGQVANASAWHRN